MVTEGVIDFLEPVEVDEQQPAGLQRRILERLPDRLEEPAAVGSSVRLSCRARCSAVTVRTVWRPLKYTPTSGTRRSG